MARFQNLVLLTLLAIAAATLPPACRVAQAQSDSHIWSAWLQALKNEGYGVVQGSALITTPAYCTQTLIPLFGSCFLNDPSDPYISPIVPLGSGYVDPYFGSVASETLPNGTAAGQDFRLDTTEAELVILNLPPPAVYFSYQSYVFTRLSGDYPKGTHNPSPDPARGMLFATFNNSINNIDVKAQSGLGFGQGMVAFITTTNAALAAAMTQQFVAVGGDPRLIFTEQMGSNLNPGLDQNSDDFVTFVRYLIAENAAAGTQWVNNAVHNVSVFRIDQPASGSISRFGATPLLNKAFNTDETGYAADVAELSQLLEGWLATQETKSSYSIKPATPSETVTPQGVVVQGAVGPYCISVGSYCIADEQDTDSYDNAAVGPISSGHLFIADGVNHALLNNSTMVSLTLVDNPASQGVLGLWQTNASAAGFTSGTLGGSATMALHTLGLWSQASPQLQAAAPMLYVQIFTRGCTPQQVYCNQPFTNVMSSTLIPYADGIGIMERAYVLPGYSNGANLDYLVLPDVIF